MEPYTPSRSAPFDVGDAVFVHGLLAFRSTAGGTETLQLSRNRPIRCRVTKSWWDYETGWRYHGEPLDEEGVERIRRKGTVDIGPDWYRENRPDDKEGLAQAEAALAAFDPRRVFFSEWDAAKV